MIGPPPDLPGLAPGGRPSPRAWGKFKRHFWGRSLRHQQIDAFVVGARQSLRLGLAVQKRGDAAIAVARPRVDQGPEAREQLGVAGLAIWGPRPASASLRLLRE